MRHKVLEPLSVGNVANAWPMQTTGTWVQPSTTYSVAWQTTSSNATYCNAAAALKVA